MSGPFPGSSKLFNRGDQPAPQADTAPADPDPSLEVPPFIKTKIQAPDMTQIEWDLMGNGGVLTVLMARNKKTPDDVSAATGVPVNDIRKVMTGEDSLVTVRQMARIVAAAGAVFNFAIHDPNMPKPSAPTNG